MQAVENLEIAKSRDSQIPTATTTTATSHDYQSKTNHSPGRKLLPICPV
jgi:hypothetical protein